MGGLDGSDVRVDEDGFDLRFTEGFDCLRACNEGVKGR
jgi:hypothetical protein